MADDDESDDQVTGTLRMRMAMAMKAMVALVMRMAMAMAMAMMAMMVIWRWQWKRRPISSKQHKTHIVTTPWAATSYYMADESHCPK